MRYFERIDTSPLVTVARRALVYIYRHRRLPNWHHPKRFTDKVNWRIVRDRRDVLIGTCDKLAMKQRVAPVAGIRVPQTYWSGTELRELALLDLPDDWVLKPNHRTSKVILGHGRPDVDALIAQTDGWLDEENWAQSGEWAYGHSARVFLVEERIGTGAKPPVDYQFYVYDGVAKYAMVITGRPSDTTATFYDRDWRRVASNPGGEYLPHAEAPSNLDEMFEVAGRIGRGFDFIRVDLYNVDGVIWFGETTPYPVSGMGRFVPDEFDFELGSHWQLPASPR